MRYQFIDSSDDENNSSPCTSVTMSDIDPAPSTLPTAPMTPAQRREERREKQQRRQGSQTLASAKKSNRKSLNAVLDDDGFATLLTRNEDDLLNFVSKVNNVYQDLLHQDAPFMTFVLCGLQSAGKSTIMERFLNAVLNIVQDGTGTRCPLDTTCIHDENCTTPTCDLTGPELDGGGENLSVEEVFTLIVKHNQKLEREDKFSTERLRLVYRSNKVQNMRFVDTPGIISTQGKGQDNREEIKTILRNEMCKPRTKLCVLLQPDEFSNNAIINICDETFEELSREQWMANATFLMTKFDKQLVVAKSGSKTNGFFQEFIDNDCFPHLVITPTLPVDKMPTTELFPARQALLDTADSHEEDTFKNWKKQLRAFKTQNGYDEDLHPEIVKRIGFGTARDVMRSIMLKDIVERLPEVLISLREDLMKCQTEFELLEEKKKMGSASEVKLIANQMLFQIQGKLKSYLDGNLAVASKFPDMMQTLDDEIDEEEDSDWKIKRLNHHMDKEDEWRDRVAKLEEKDFITEIRPDERFLGGKQYQRAIEFFKVVMISALPDPNDLKDLIPQATGFAQDGLQRENWERAMVETVKTCLKDVSQPGVNFLIKHAGSIFRRLFLVAIEDVKSGEAMSRQFCNLPGGVEKQMIAEYEDMLWNLMENAAVATHLSLEPMFSTIDPNLPTFNSQSESDEDDTTTSPESVSDESLASKVANFGKTLRVSITGTEAKKKMRDVSVQRITTKKFFLPDKRASMITDEESDIIVRRSFEYIIALFEFILALLKFQLNHHIYQGFKDAIQGRLITQINNIKWEELIQNDPLVDERLNELEKQIEGLKESLQEVKRMEHSF